MYYSWNHNLNKAKIKEYATFNMETFDKIQVLMAKLAKEDEGDINNLLDQDIKDIEQDFVKEYVFQIIHHLNSICYYYKKTDRDILASEDFWKPKFKFYSKRKLFQTAFEKYRIMNYEESMFALMHKSKHAEVIKEKHEIKPKIVINKNYIQKE
jgi:hypothetical protein